MNISTKGLKKVAQDDKKTTLQHPDGHQIVIAHSKLKPEHAAALLKMPMQKLAEGGDVKPTAGSNGSNTGTYTPPSGSRTRDVKASSNGISGADITKPTTWFKDGGEAQMPPPAPDSPDALMQGVPSNIDNTALAPQGPKMPGDQGYSSKGTNFDKMLKYAGSVSAGQAGNTDNMTPPGSKATSAPSALDAAGASAGNDLTNPTLPGSAPQQAPGMPASGANGIDMAMGAYQTLANNQAQTSAALQPAYEQQATAQANLAQTAQAHIENFQQESSKLIDAFNKGQIDPDHYMKSLSTGGKVSTAIGLLLGGIGGGMTHQANPALEFLNKQIDRDIDGQKANLGKNATMFGMLKEQLGSDLAATNMSKSFMTDALINKIQAEANKRGGSDAQAKANLAIAPLQMQKDQYAQKAAMYKSAQDMLQTPGHSNADHAYAARVMLDANGVKPEDQVKAASELAEVQGLNELQAKHAEAFQKLNQMALAGTLTPAARHALIMPIANETQMLVDHRANPETAESLGDAIFGNKFDANSTRGDELKAFTNMMDVARTKATPILNSYKIPIPKPAPVGNKLHTIK